eukprot:c27447_g1_i1 orf=687-2546(-)
MASVSKQHERPVAEEPDSKRAKIDRDGPFKVALNRVDCNIDFTVANNGLSGKALHEGGFAYCWSGARANLGIKDGRYCFGCRVVAIQPVEMEDTPDDQQNLCRVGVSRGDDNVGSLGESEHSFGYGGTGKFSNSGKFLDYGGRFGVGDTIICAVDLDTKTSEGKVAFAKNGNWLGVARKFNIGPNGLALGESYKGKLKWEGALFPHVLLKNVEIRMLFSTDDGLRALEGFQPWDTAHQDGNGMEGPKLGDCKDSEVMMMVGLPAAGKTTWAEKWAMDHPEKRYMLLGTNLVLDLMKVPGLMRKKNYGERFDRLMDRATKIFNKLVERAASIPRNYIMDQTNVYRSARNRKLKAFKGFRKVAVVIFPSEEHWKMRSVARSREMGKEVPAEAVNEMLANFVLPLSKDMPGSIEPFDEVWFPELQREQADKLLQKMKSSIPPAPPRFGSQSFAGSVQDRNSREGNSREGSFTSVQGSYSSPHFSLGTYGAGGLRAPAGQLVPDGRSRSNSLGEEYSASDSGFSRLDVSPYQGKPQHLERVIPYQDGSFQRGLETPPYQDLPYRVGPMNLHPGTANLQASTYRSVAAMGNEASDRILPPVLERRPYTLPPMQYPQPGWGRRPY